MARIDIHPDGIVTVRDLRLSSGNPFVSIAVRAARRSLRAEIGRTYDLNDSVGAGAHSPRLHDVRVTVGDDITVAARLG